MTVLSDLIIGREVADVFDKDMARLLSLAISEIRRLSEFVCASCNDAPRQSGEWCAECVELHTGRSLAEWRAISFTGE